MADKPVLKSAVSSPQMLSSPTANVSAGNTMYIRTGAPMSDFYKSRVEQRQRLERERQEKEEAERQHRLRFRSFEALVKELIDDGTHCTRALACATAPSP